MNSEQSQLDQDKRGAKHRSRVMLAATLDVRGFEVNVRIRNISESGALLEGEVLPEVGTSVTLLRGDNVAAAEIVWVRAGRCGIRFRSHIEVSLWAGVQPVAAAPASFGAVAPDAPPLPSSLLPNSTPEEDCEARLPFRVGEEIAYVQRLIDTMERELAANPLIVHRHGRALQNFDLASQILGHLARVLMADNRVRAAERVGMKELKARLLRS